MNGIYFSNLKLLALGWTDVRSLFSNTKLT